MMNSIKQSQAFLSAQKQFETLPARDQLALKVLSGVLGIFLLYFACWVPAKSYMTEAQSQVEAREELLSLVQTNKAVLKSMSKSTAGSSGQTQLNSQQLVSTVTNLAKNKGLNLKRFEPSGDSKLKVWLDAQPFDKMVAWLDELKRSFNVTVEQISIERDDKDGLVGVRMTLSS